MYLRAAIVIPGIATTCQYEPLIDLDVEEDQHSKGYDAKQEASGAVHVVLDVYRIISKKADYDTMSTLYFPFNTFICMILNQICNPTSLLIEI